MSESIPTGRWLTGEEVAREMAKSPARWEGTTEIYRLEFPVAGLHFVAGSEVVLYGNNEDGAKMREDIRRRVLRFRNGHKAQKLVFHLYPDTAIRLLLVGILIGAVLRFLILMIRSL